MLILIFNLFRLNCRVVNYTSYKAGKGKVLFSKIHTRIVLVHR